MWHLTYEVDSPRDAHCLGQLYGGPEKGEHVDVQNGKSRREVQGPTCPGVSPLTGLLRNLGERRSQIKQKQNKDKKTQNNP